MPPRSLTLKGLPQSIGVYIRISTQQNKNRTHHKGKPKMMCPMYFIKVFAELFQKAKVSLLTSLIYQKGKGKYGKYIVIPKNV